MQKTCLLIGLTIVFFSCHTGKINLVENGKSDYVIVIPDYPNAQEERAADLMQKYVKEISGCTLPITDSIGNDAKGIFIKEVSGLEYDGYKIDASNTSFHIHGGKQKGCIYGVITILEKYLNCRLYSPTYKLIPKNKDIDLPHISLADSSVNSYRTIYIVSDAFGGDTDLLDWNRLSGGEDHGANHSFYWLLPPEEYFKEHPEYFCMVNGKRYPDQICLSNKDVLNHVTEKLKAAMAASPDQKYWRVAQNDGYMYCQCEACKKVIEEEKSPSGPVIRFVNGIARQFPDKVFTTLAYVYSQPAPAVTKPLDNVSVTLCAYKMNAAIPYVEDPSQPEKTFIRDLTDWSKISKNVFVWDYVANFVHAVAPHPNLYTQQRNLQFFRQRHIREFFLETLIYEGSEFAELRLLLTSRLLWNPNADVEKIIDNFLNDYYGDAAPWIKKYINQTHRELWQSGERLELFSYPVSFQNSFLSEENLKDYNHYFNEAEKAVKNNEVFYHHVQTARVPLYYATMEIAKYNMFGPRGWYDSSGVHRNLAMDSIMENFHAICKRENITRLKEGGLSPDYYCERLRYTVDHAVRQGNLAFRKKVAANPLPQAYTDYNGGLGFLTDGVRWDYNGATSIVSWLGWEAADAELLLDLEKSVKADTIELSSLHEGSSILHPASVECLVANKQEGKFTSVGKIDVKGNQRNENWLRRFIFDVSAADPFRFVKFKVKGTITIPEPYPDAGLQSRFYVDEIVVK